MLADKPTKLSRIKLKTWTRQPVPMISGHSAHLTPLSVDFRTWLWRYTYLLLLISMLWQRKAIFKSKGDKLCSSAECSIWTLGPRHQMASRLNARWQTDWAIEDQAKNLNSTARPYDQRAFSPLDTTARVSNSYDQPQLPPTKMATAENGETKQSRISGKPDRALCPYDTDMSVAYHTMYFSYDHVF